MGISNLITMNHLDVMNKVILTMSCLMGYAYFMEGYTAWYSMNEYIHHIFKQYVAGDYGWAGVLTLTCNVLIPQLFWVKRFRRSIPVMIFVAVTVTVGMWFERFVIFIISLHQDYLPSAWGHYVPTAVDVGILLGSFGLFFTLVLIFARALPVIATTEVKMHLPGAQPRHQERNDG
jgi:molybdopterin-containing oxidoreductase family membrane subunit